MPPLPRPPPIPPPRTPRATRVRIYTGEGAGWRSVRSAAAALARLLPPPYRVDGIGSAELLSGGWEDGAALLVLPGGADLPYARRLNGPDGNGRIRAFVAERGGAVLGLCAGAYYLCSRVEWEAGEAAAAAAAAAAGAPPGAAAAAAAAMKPAPPPVVGDRELAFFPGVGRGAAFPGFDYATEAGAVAAPLAFRVPAGAAGAGAGAAEAAPPPPSRWVSAADYCNGGPFFVPHGPEGGGEASDGDPWPLERDPRFEVLARYERVRHPRAGERAAAAPTAAGAREAAEAAAAAAAAAAAVAAADADPFAPCPARGPLAAVRVAVGAGAAVLCATHPELAPGWLDPITGGSHERQQQRPGGRGGGDDDGDDDDAGGDAASGSESDGKAAAAAAIAAEAATAAAAAAAAPPGGRQQVVGRVKLKAGAAAAAAGDAAAAAAAAPDPPRPRPSSPLTDHTAALRARLESSQAARELFLTVLVYEALRR